MILTHADLDGMVSGILLLQGLGASADLSITNGERLANKLELLATDTNPPGSVYIADIPLDATKVDCLLQILKELRDSGTRLHLYDHHFGWKETRHSAQFRPLFDTYDVDTRKTTAAALVWRDFLGCRKESQRWLQLLSEKADSGEEQIRADFLLLAAGMQPRYRGVRIDIVRALAFGEPVPEREAMVAWYENVYLPKETTLAQSAIILRTDKGTLVGWIDLRECDDLYPGIGRLIIDLHQVDLAACVIPNGVLIGHRAIDGGTDLRFLHGRHVVDGVTLDVVGHKSPVRVRPIYGKADDAFVSAVRRLIAVEL